MFAETTTDARILHISSPRLIAVLLGCGASVFFFNWPGGGFFPAGVFSVFSFLLVPTVFPRCAFSRAPLVSPLNWMLACFFLQLVVMPATVRLWGPLHSFLPRQPGMFSINLATLLITLGYWTFAAAIHFGLRPARVICQRSHSTFLWPLPSLLIFLFAMAGVLGFAAHYKSLAAFQQFLFSPADFLLQFNRDGAPASVLDVLGDFLAPLLGFALVMLWARTIERNRLHSRSGRWAGLALLLPIALAFATFGYNRSHFVFPLIALAAAASARLPRDAIRYLLLTGSLVAALVLASVIYRFSAHPEDAGTRPSAAVLDSLETRELFALYGQAPQYMGALLEAEHNGLAPHYGVLGLSGALGQVPVLGKPFRPLSGYALYAAVTGHPEESPAFTGEVFLDFNLFGVIASFAAIGAITAWLQRRILFATHAFEVYLFQLIAIYLSASILLSVEVLTQFAIYSMFPIFLYLVFRWVSYRIRGRWARYSPHTSSA